MVSLTVDGRELIAKPCYSNRNTNSAVCIDCYEPHEEYFHYHPEYELMLSQNTHGKWIVGNIVESFADYDLILIGPKLPHARLGHGQTDRAATVVSAHFTRDSIGVELLSKNELRPVRHLLDASRRGVRFLLDGYEEEVVDRIKELPDLTQSQQYFRFMDVLDTLARSVDWEALLTEEYDLTWAENDELMFQKIQEYIWAHHDEPFSRNDVAEYVGLSISSLSRLLKRMTNKSFVEYLNEFRIHRACNLIRNGTEPIYEIGFKVGFRNSSYFNKQFKALMNMTPSTYRATQTSLSIKSK